ncbi:MAG: hypothetical protein M3512_07470 [Bacteroidota bacterium]|nr:hypothetical protein [Bacteroidota bacterium]
MTEVLEKHITLEYDNVSKCIYQTWKGYFSSEQFRNGVAKTNKMFEKYNPVNNFIVDISESAAIKKEDTDWAAKTAIPLAIKNGLKFYGFVLPKNVFAQLSLSNFRKELNQPSLEIQLFDSLDKAKAWANSK